MPATTTADETDATLTSDIDAPDAYCVFSRGRPLRASVADDLQLVVRPSATECEPNPTVEVEARYADAGGREFDNLLFAGTLSPAALSQEATRERTATQITGVYAEVPEKVRVGDLEDVEERLTDALDRLADPAPDAGGDLLALDAKGVDLLEATAGVTISPADGEYTVEYVVDEAGTTEAKTYTAEQWGRSKQEHKRSRGRNSSYDIARLPKLPAYENYDNGFMIGRKEDAHRWRAIRTLWTQMTVEDAESGE